MIKQPYNTRFFNIIREEVVFYCHLPFKSTLLVKWQSHWMS